MSAALDRQAITHAYRHLYKQGLQAVRYSTPARHVIRLTLRSSFRNSDPSEFDPRKISNTLQFLEKAGRDTGYEHKILKNLLTVRYWEQPFTMKETKYLRGLGVKRTDSSLRQDALDHFNTTLMLLNESLGTCLR